VVLGLHIGRRDVMLTVQDDGTGAPPVLIEPVAGGATGFGLRSVGERILGLNGSFVAGPNPDGGFLVRTRLPLEDNSAA
jgi:signal transduction histidine kinase